MLVATSNRILILCPHCNTGSVGHAKDILKRKLFEILKLTQEYL